ncbi:MAG: Lrp/AsnC ligand binding domain-containing protein [Bacteriovorax sp.]
MSDKYELDNLDRKILKILQTDAKVPFSEIAQKLIVSGGTIHQRVAKLEDAGVIKGSKYHLDYTKLGYDVNVLLGIHLKNAKDCPIVIEQLKKLPEVIEAHYTTGNYALIIRVINKTIGDYHKFLIEKLQSIKEIQSTESYICLDTPIFRDLHP